MKSIKYVIISDFDKTLTYGDSGMLLFREKNKEEEFKLKIEELRKKGLCNLGAELSYLLKHEYSSLITKSDLINIGKKVKKKDGLEKFLEILNSGLIEPKNRRDKKFKLNISFYVVSAAPYEIVKSSLRGLVSEDHIFATKFIFDSDKIKDIEKVYAGNAKVDAIKEIAEREICPLSNLIYVGDGSSDIYAMHFIKQKEGYSISVSMSETIGAIANKTVISNNVTAILVPILKDIFGYSNLEIKDLFEEFNIPIKEWSTIEIYSIKF